MSNAVQIKPPATFSVSELEKWLRTPLTQETVHVGPEAGAAACGIDVRPSGSLEPIMEEI